MNLTKNPTRDQLRGMLARLNDENGPHIPWIEQNGTVHISRLPDEQSTLDFESALGSKLKFRLETMEVGNGYVGPDAAADDEWVSRLLNGLVKLWAEDAEGYQDDF